MVDEESKRKFPRTRLRAAVTVKHPDVGEQRAHTRDISDGGAFVVAEGLKLPGLGAVVEVQVQGLPGEAAPIVRMRVVRIDKDGMGLEFVEDSETDAGR